MMKGNDVFFAGVHRRVCEEFGEFQLTREGGTPCEDLFNYFLRLENVGACLDIMEIVSDSLREYVRADSYVNVYGMEEIARGEEKINARFRENAVGYELQDGMVMRIDSAFLHTEAVTPTMTLLEERHFQGANAEFLRAHEHFRHDRFPESINECLKAFESTMKAICHKRGWSYQQTDTAKRLVAVCEANGLFPAFMQSSLSGLRSLLENVATMRNKLSAHGQGVQPVRISRTYAAFMLNATATNILFLVSLEQELP